MADVIESYQEYMNNILICGLARPVSIHRDLVSVCVNFLWSPNGQLNVDNNITIEMSKIHEMLLHYSFAPESYLYHFDNESALRWTNVTQQQKFYKFHHSFQSITDTKLLNVMIGCVQWEVCTFENYNFYHNYEQYDKYLTIIIHLCKKGLNIRCRYMLKLIELYEFYYFQNYVIDDFKNRMKINMNKIRNKMKFQRNLCYEIKRILKDSISFKCSFAMNQQWNNANSTEMSQLIKIIAELYDENDVTELMSNLSVILEFVRARYKMMVGVLLRKLPEEIKDLLGKNRHETWDLDTLPVLSRRKPFDMLEDVYVEEIMDFEDWWHINTPY